MDMKIVRWLTKFAVYSSIIVSATIGCGGLLSSIVKLWNIHVRVCLFVWGGVQDMELPGLSDTATAVTVGEDSMFPQTDAPLQQQPLANRIGHLFSRPVSLPGMSATVQEGLLRVQRRGSFHGRVPLGEVDGRPGLERNSGHQLQAGVDPLCQISSQASGEECRPEATATSWAHSSGSSASRRLHLLQFISVTSLVPVSQGVYAYPADPPPPYLPCQLPPYMGRDAAPSYKSHDSSSMTAVSLDSNCT